MTHITIVGRATLLCIVRPKYTQRFAIALASPEKKQTPRILPVHCITGSLITAAATTTTTVVIIILLSIDYIDENGGSNEGKLVFRGGVIRKDNMIGITLSAAFILPSREKLADLGILPPDIALDGFEGIGITHDEGNAAAFAARPSSAAAAHDATSADASVGAETVLFGAGSIVDIELGDKEAQIADVLRLADDIAIGVLRLEVGFEATSGPTRLGLLVRRDDVLVAIFLREALREDARLARAPVEVFPGDDGGRGRARVLDILRRAASWCDTAAATHEEGGLLMDPRLLLVIVMGIPAVIIVGLANYPVDGGLAAAGAATLARGLGDDDLLRGAEPLHRHGPGGVDQRSLHLSTIVLDER